MFSDFKNDGFMYMIILAVIIFVCAQALFFMRKAWIRGKELGITTDKLKNAVTSSAIFSFAPAIGIAITVISLSVALGYVLPWIRLTVIGAIQYETTAAIGALQAATGDPSANIATAVTDPQIFGEIVWVMTLGSILPLILIPIVLKKIQKGVSDVASKNSKWMDIMTAAAFIGLIAAFIGKGLAGMGSKDKIGDGAGVLSLAALVFSTGFMIFFTLINKKLKKNWIEALAMPVSMVLAMAAVVLINTFAPELAQIEWRY